MKFSTENPPYNIRELCEANFDLRKIKPVWVYGDTLYNPHQMPINKVLLEHEKIHSKQQGDKPAEWWHNYFNNDKFRFEQELEAYRHQYHFVKGFVKGRNDLFNFLKLIASDMSGKMYGNMCSLQEAICLIKK